MDGSHRANVLVTSCLKTPVDPHTKVPLALYERARAAPVITDGGQESVSESDPGAVGTHPKVSRTPPVTDGCKPDDHIDLRELYLSNEQYYRQLEQLRRDHLCTMADLELMYLKKLELKGSEPLRNHDRTCLLQYHQTNGRTARKLKKSHSAHELRSNPYMDEVCNVRGDHVDQNITNDLVSLPKEYIKNMWQGFRVDKTSQKKPKPSSASLENRPGDHRSTVESNQVQRSKKGKGRTNDVGWCPQVTVPKPFRMTLREMEYKRNRVRSRVEIEQENEELRREIEELTECQHKFRATAVPAHVRLPLYEELRERDEERRRQLRAAEQQRLLAAQRPFSFLEREQIKKQQKELQMLLSTKEQLEHRRRPFRAKPVPRAVQEAAMGERHKEEQLYREIKKEMRATEMLLSANEPPSTLSKRISERRMQREEQSAPTTGIRISSQVPDFDISYRRFQKQLARKREFRPLTTCEPFKLCTANISPRKERLTANTEAGRRNKSASQCMFVSLSPQTPSSSVSSSLSGSREYLPSKITDAAKKRQEAVRKVLEQRKKAEQEEAERKERQKQKERKFQKLIVKRAQANDPHVALAQICESKLKEFRKQDLQRRREYEEEMREIQERVKSRPLLLEQVAQMNAKKVAEKCYTDVLRAFGLSEAFVISKGPTSEHDYTLSGRSVIHSPLTNRKDQTADHLEGADFENVLSADYPVDYKDYEQDVEDVLVDRKNERQQEDEGEQLDPGEDGDGCLSYEDHLDFDDYDDQDEDESDEGCGDRSHSRHSDTSRAGDNGKRSMSSLTDEGRKKGGKSRNGSQESTSNEETEGRERGEENSDDKD
ncbi:protein FAM161A isoform X2 [Tachysurus fulvidraco]|uniref:protein FAM161A isoform X2 n=1 Tax=Tachysurus fulvidraco TaxID=1234273 RepID=UPI001FEFFB2F|nr:protein FAM161A isoform X2 [Tachysurus fulvidraco]